MIFIYYAAATTSDLVMKSEPSVNLRTTELG